MDLADHADDRHPLAIAAADAGGDRLRDRPARHRVHLAAAGATSRRWRRSPTHVGLKPLALQRLFTRWAGLSPKGFLQAVTLDHARSLLADSASVLDASYEVGLSGPGRLHDLFVTHEAMTPGDLQGARRGRSSSATASTPRPSASALVMVDRARPRRPRLRRRGRRGGGARRHAARAGRARPTSRIAAATAPYVRRIFDPADLAAGPAAPRRHDRLGFRDHACGRRCCKLPLGKATTYSDIAAHIGRPTAARAVGTAVGTNPISFVVPCHRVLGKGGGLCGYHWGLTRKRAILGWEAGVVGQGAPELAELSTC